jgi:hypothetical protein
MSIRSKPAVAARVPGRRPPRLADAHRAPTATFAVAGANVTIILHKERRDMDEKVLRMAELMRVYHDTPEIGSGADYRIDDLLSSDSDAVFASTTLDIMNVVVELASGDNNMDPDRQYGATMRINDIVLGFLQRPESIRAGYTSWTVIANAMNAFERLGMKSGSHDGTDVVSNHEHIAAGYKVGVTDGTQHLMNLLTFDPLLEHPTVFQGADVTVDDLTYLYEKLPTNVFAAWMSTFLWLLRRTQESVAEMEKFRASIEDALQAASRRFNMESAAARDENRAAEQTYDQARKNAVERIKNAKRDDGPMLAIEDMLLNRPHNRRIPR